MCEDLSVPPAIRSRWFTEIAQSSTRARAMVDRMDHNRFRLKNPNAIEMAQQNCKTLKFTLKENRAIESECGCGGARTVRFIWYSIIREFIVAKNVGNKIYIYGEEQMRGRKRTIKLLRNHFLLCSVHRVIITLALAAHLAEAQSQARCSRCIRNELSCTRAAGRGCGRETFNPKRMKYLIFFCISLWCEIFVNVDDIVRKTTSFGIQHAFGS